MFLTRNIYKKIRCFFVKLTVLLVFELLSDSSLVVQFLIEAKDMACLSVHPSIRLAVCRLGKLLSLGCGANYEVMTFDGVHWVCKLVRLVRAQVDKFSLHSLYKSSYNTNW